MKYTRLGKYNILLGNKNDLVYIDLIHSSPVWQNDEAAVPQKNCIEMTRKQAEQFMLDMAKKLEIQHICKSGNCGG